MPRPRTALAWLVAVALLAAGGCRAIQVQQATFSLNVNLNGNFPGAPSK